MAESKYQEARAGLLEEHFGMMDKVIVALGHALGIKDQVVDLTNMMDPKLMHTTQECDPTELQELYNDPRARFMIDKFIEVGKVDRARLGL